jgi:hypothetical protein
MTTPESAPDWELSDLIGRYEIHDVGPVTLLLDSCTGQAWILKHYDAKPVWVGVSAAGKG